MARQLQPWRANLKKHRASVALPLSPSRWSRTRQENLVAFELPKALALAQQMNAGFINLARARPLA
jgi:hypothetical protein